MLTEKAPSQLQMAKEKYGASSTKKDNDNVNVKVSVKCLGVHLDIIISV